MLSRRLAPLWLFLLAIGCASRPTPGGTVAPSTEQTLDELFNLPSVYQRLGRLAASGPMPFVGNLAYLKGRGDSTVVRVGLSLESHAFAFVREGSNYAAHFRVEYSLARTGQAPIQTTRDEVVRVESFGETQRSDESVIVEQGFLLAPGSYTLTVTVRDPAANVFSRGEQAIQVPGFAAGSMTAPIFVYQVRPRLQLNDSLIMLLNPRGTVANGGGDSLLLYVEAYDVPAARQVPVRVRGDRDSVLYQANLGLRGGTPVEGHLVRIAADAPPLGQLSVEVGEGAERKQVTALVSFSRNWVVTNYDNLLALLRFFPWRQDLLNSLRQAKASERPQAWREFWTATDPNPQTGENEALDLYFTRIAIANERFKDEGGPGWRTDRGEVFVTLGEPDQMYENPPGSDQRIVQWSYGFYRVVITFTGPVGFSRLRLTTQSRAEFARARAMVMRQGAQ
jgi:GWxTD domain-containing protein